MGGEAPVAGCLTSHLGPENFVQHAEHSRVIDHDAGGTARAAPLVWRQLVRPVLHRVHGVPQAGNGGGVDDGWTDEEPLAVEPGFGHKKWARVLQCQCALEACTMTYRL